MMTQLQGRHSLSQPMSFAGFMYDDPVNGEWYDSQNIESDKIYEFDVIEGIPAFYKSSVDLFEEEGVPDYVDHFLYAGAVTVDGVQYDSWLKFTDGELAYADGGEDGAGTRKIYALTEHIIVHAGKGVIYRMVDEWGNEAPYDFKNIVKVEHDGGGNYLMYTFSYVDTSYNVWDLSVVGQEANPDIGIERVSGGVHHNVIKSYTDGKKNYLRVNITYVDTYSLYDFAELCGYYNNYIGHKILSTKIFFHFYLKHWNYL
jgi:hypothetical protein